MEGEHAFEQWSKFEAFRNFEKPIPPELIHNIT